MRHSHHPHASNALRLNTLGGAVLLGPSGEPLVQQRRRIALLVLIAAGGAQGATRDRLMALLSPDSPADSARHALQQLVYYLRQQAGDALFLGTDPLHLNPAVITSDLIEFEHAIENGALANAVALYRGPFLDGFHLGESAEFEEWMAQQRTRLSARYRDALFRLASDAAAQGDPAGAIDWWRRLANHDPLDGQAALGLLRALAAVGDGAGAMRHARAHTALVRSELDREPDPEISAFALAQAGKGPSPAPAVPAESPLGSMKHSAPAASKEGTRGFGRLVRPALALSGMLIVLAGFVLFRPWSDGVPDYPSTAIAVLPFENLSADSAQAWFADGLHDEVLTQLSKVAALSLRGRSSVKGYAGTTKAVRQIAEELRVGTLMQGSVQVVAGRLRVHVQLVDAATDEHLWAESYDRTLDDGFAIQREIARQVVAAVGAAVTRGEQQALAQPPTTNAEAYLFYLQGRDYLRRSTARRSLESAEQLYRQALALDPEFALAHAELSEVHGWMHWNWYDPSPDRKAAQRSEAELALRLAPELPQAHLALGLWHYWARRDFPAALPELETAQRGLPNDAVAFMRVSSVKLRMGRWDEVYAGFERLVELDPRNPAVFYHMGATFLASRRYADAVRAFDRAVTIAPDEHRAAVMKGWTYALWQGRLDTLGSVLDRVPAGADLGGGLSSAVRVRAHLLLWQREPDSLLRHLEHIPPGVVEGDLYYFPREVYAAWAHRLQNDSTAARQAFASSLPRLDSLQRERPDDRRVHAARGLALAGLGRRNEALREARWFEESVYRDDAYNGPMAVEMEAQILAQAGEADAALDRIERLLAGSSTLTVHSLRLDPLWDPLRNHPRFQALLAEYESR